MMLAALLRGFKTCSLGGKVVPARAVSIGARGKRSVSFGARGKVESCSRARVHSSRTYGEPNLSKIRTSSSSLEKTRSRCNWHSSSLWYFCSIRSAFHLSRLDRAVQYYMYGRRAVVDL